MKQVFCDYCGKKLQQDEIMESEKIRGDFCFDHMPKTNNIERGLNMSRFSLPSIGMFVLGLFLLFFAYVLFLALAPQQTKVADGGNSAIPLSLVSEVENFRSGGDTEENINMVNILTATPGDTNKNDDSFIQSTNTPTFISPPTPIPSLEIADELPPSPQPTPTTTQVSPTQQAASPEPHYSNSHDILIYSFIPDSDVFTIARKKIGDHYIFFLYASRGDGSGYGLNMLDDRKVSLLQMPPNDTHYFSGEGLMDNPNAIFLTSGTAYIPSDTVFLER